MSHPWTMAQGGLWGGRGNLASDASLWRFGALYAGSQDAGSGTMSGPCWTFSSWGRLAGVWVSRWGGFIQARVDAAPADWWPWEYPVNQPEWADFALNLVLSYALASNETYRLAGPRDWVASPLNVLTVPGPAPEWWFNPDRAADLSDAEAVIAWQAMQSGYWAYAALERGGDRLGGAGVSHFARDGLAAERANARGLAPD